MAETSDLSAFTHAREDGALGMDFAVEGVSCGGCIRRIETAVRHIPGIVDARLNFTTKRLSVAWAKDPGAGAVPDDIVRALDRMGYAAHPFAPAAAEDEDDRQAKQLLRYVGIAGFAAMNVMLLSVSVWSGNVTDITPETRDFFHWLSALIALPAAAYAGQPFFRSAYAALRSGGVNMDVPISLGVTLALGMSLVETANHAEHAYFDSAVMLLFFLLCGRYLDLAMRRRTRATAGNLAAFRAETAHRLDADGQLVSVPAATLRPGDRLVVRPGDRIPADGLVLDGASEIDESLITGETLPRALKAGDTVYAGSLNFSGALTLRVTAAGEKTLLDEIERLLDKAVHSRSRSVQLADRAARYYAPVVHTAAALTLVGWLMAGASAHDAIITAISVLIITCPCALALAIPTVQVVTAGKLFRAGIFLNSGAAIERLAEVDTVVFDKTGTLTLPEARVANAAAIPVDLLETAGRLALSSRHPLAIAVAREGADKRPFDHATEEHGQGVRAMVNGIEARLGSLAFCGIADVDRAATAPDASLIGFCHGDRHAVFQVRQTLRPDAKNVINALRQRGLGVSILSGDRASAVAPLAAALGIADWQAGMTPRDKVAALQALKSQGHRTLMVGDGLNDAPSLAEAHVSMSPITAAELSQAHADAVFLGARLSPVADALVTARRARTLMMQNLWLAAIYNAFAVPIAIAGLVTPLVAALAMSGSSVLVTLNALRVRWPRRAPRVESVAPVAATAVEPRWSTP